jgi:hypothetical protein
MRLPSVRIRERDLKLIERAIKKSGRTKAHWIVEQLVTAAARRLGCEPPR